jgi:hypothetical protein
METITTKTETRGKLPDEDTPKTENILMETEESPVGQVLAPDRMETVGVAAKTLNLAGATTTAKGSRDPEGSGSYTCPPGEAAIQQTASGVNRLHLNNNRLSGAQQRKLVLCPKKPFYFGTDCTSHVLGSA